jgi:hypothetical protein
MAAGLNAHGSIEGNETLGPIGDHGRLLLT